MASRLVLAIVFVLDLIAFAFAVAAEQRRSTVSPSLSVIWLLIKNSVKSLGFNSFFFVKIHLGVLF